MKQWFYLALILLMNTPCITMDNTAKLKDDISELERHLETKTKLIQHLKKQNAKLNDDLEECEEENHRLKQPSKKLILYNSITFPRMPTEKASVQLSLLKCSLHHNKLSSEKAYRENKELRNYNESLTAKFERREILLECCCLYGIITTGIIAYNWWTSQTHDKTA